jgi:opacity protein-like surface antigen
MNFGSGNVILPPPNVRSATTPVNLKQDFDEVKVGINYHFGKDELVVASAVPVKAPPAPVFNWTGVYVGAAIADRLSFSSWQTSAVAQHCNPNFPCTPANVSGLPVLPDPTTNPASFFSSNVQGRLYSGYNWQFAPKWVVGVDGDVGFGNSKMNQGGIPGTFGNGRNAGNGASPFNNLPGIDAVNADSSAVKMGWDSTIRGKLGTLVTPTTLFYGTGGIAFQDVSVSANCVPTNGGQIGSFPSIAQYASSYCGLAHAVSSGGAASAPCGDRKKPNLLVGAHRLDRWSWY